MKEYVVTLKNVEDLSDFYDDMETPGGNLYIPNRAVECSNRRPISRNTHYILTDQEAEQLRNDSRVLSCEVTPESLGIEARPCWTQNSTAWNKSASTNNTMKNWALLRCIEGVTRSNWGSEFGGTTNQSATIQCSLEGRNVDVVIVDGLINPNHPEFAVNNDGTGGSRVIQYNWLQHANTPGTFVYGNYTGTSAEGNNNHGCHVAGTVAGTTQGWARSANIYNISPYYDDGNFVSTLEIFDYIRAFHRNKPINPNTGVKNPTICNNSWGYFYNTVAISTITLVNYKGISYTNNLTSSNLNSYGVFNNGSNVTSVGYRYPPLDYDIQDAINDGIIIVGAAGNNSFKIDNVLGNDYNNYFVSNGNYYYYNEGASPGSSSTVICVGSIASTTQDRKRLDSACGPRIDIYAPGEYIISSVNSGSTSDSRNTSYKLAKFSGTSMASPQVAGILACTLEAYPNMTQTDARNYIQTTAKKDQVYDSGGTDTTGLQGSINRYLYLYKERPDNGATWPKMNYKLRPSSGQLYPRTRIRR